MEHQEGGSGRVFGRGGRLVCASKKNQGREGLLVYGGRIRRKGKSVGRLARLASPLTRGGLPGEGYNTCLRLSRVFYTWADKHPPFFCFWGDLWDGDLAWVDISCWLGTEEMGGQGLV